jgi:hypothetical protein
LQHTIGPPSTCRDGSVLRALHNQLNLKKVQASMRVYQTNSRSSDDCSLCTLITQLSCERVWVIENSPPTPRRLRKSANTCIGLLLHALFYCMLESVCMRNGVNTIALGQRIRDDPSMRHQDNEKHNT